MELVTNMFSTDHKARRRIEELEDAFNRLQRDFKSLEMEWSNAYDKLLTMMQRIAKRAEVLQKEMDGGKPPLSASEQVLQIGHEGNPSQGFLTPAQRRMQQQIVRRRNLAQASPLANGTED